jgi:4-hydroxy 2-oxovalerate aldolase
MEYKILDCTLRDGGYYTDWDFDDNIVKSLVKSLDDNGVDIIEMGYKSPVKGGPYRKCNDGFIKSIINFNINAKLAFMIDVKDYVKNDEINTDLLKDIVKKSDKSPFDVCRIAAKYDEIKYINHLIQIIEELGYEVICNLMGVSTLEIEQIRELTKVNSNILYIADSYGSLLPNDVENIFKNVELHGIHTHDNLGLAFANCLTAINNGATYIDGTITGMGRGVGNVRTEQLLVFRNKKITPELLDVIDYFNLLKNKFKWGHNSLYMLSALNNIHPLYSQKLNNLSVSNSSKLNMLEYLYGNNLYHINDMLKAKFKNIKSLFFIRHGQSLSNNKNVINGWTDSDLSEIGVEQVKNSLENIKRVGINNIYTSDLKRTVKTSEIISSGNININKLFGLRERNWGQLESKPKELLKDLNICPIGGESIEEYENRVKLTLLDIEINENTLIVAHKGTLRVICGIIDIDFFEIENSVLIEFKNVKGSWVWRKI